MLKNILRGAIQKVATGPEFSKNISEEDCYNSMLNILDIVLVINFVLGSETPSATEFSAADLNSDGILNILDVVILTNLILGD